MKISVRVNVNSKTEAVEQTGEREYKVSFKAKPIKGEANIKAIQLLSEHLGIPKTCLRIVKGLRSKTKNVEIAE